MSKQKKDNGPAVPPLQEEDTQENLLKTIEESGKIGGDHLTLVAEEVDFLKSSLRSLQRTAKRTETIVEDVDARTIAITSDLAKLIEDRRKVSTELERMREVVVSATSQLTSAAHALKEARGEIVSLLAVQKES